MNKIRTGTNFAVFILFFGVSLLDAFESHQWIRAAFWLAIALFFLAADLFKREKNTMDQ